MAVRPLPFAVAVALVLGACSQQRAVEADENAAVNDAVEVGDLMHNSMTNAIDGAQNAVDAMVGTDQDVALALAASQPPGWGSNYDIFGDRDIVLDPIADAGALHRSGEMGCGFVAEAATAPILVAKADVDPAAHAVAVVSNGGVRGRLASGVAGGFGALAQGVRFVGKGVSAEVTLTSRVSLTPVGQQSSYPASLAVSTGAQRQHVYAGRWICGLQK